MAQRYRGCLSENIPMTKRIAVLGLKGLEFESNRLPPDEIKRKMQKCVSLLLTN